ncbi:hypothetical protein NPA09_01725 [Mycoplasmopsis equigenitalium]|uniref:ECF transporter S component n=1 Tax=Mycoplasmopsis equigenitalium TaxID=114883 RepID=A0ABY5J428_9BACT|nr:hypothetical protein [Mycoplasmopsis equigenitalium]UUD37271.1 hypothetical protein NPA09_01725 [Mycoplasmopsis equigenitalium]
MNTNYRYNPVTIKIAYLSMMLALVILFNYLSNFMTVFQFLKLDLSSIFIIISFIYISKIGAISLALIRFGIGPSYSHLGYDPVSVLGHSILLITTIILVLLLWLMMFLIKKVNTSFIKKQVLVYSVSVIICSLIMFILNALLFTPAYLYLFNSVKSIDFRPLAANWENMKWMTLGIENYWLGMFVLYSAFNLLSYGLNALASILLEIAFSKSNIIKPTIFKEKIN